jgi:peptide/nickel transport system substrate-binding protein
MSRRRAAGLAACLAACLLAAGSVHAESVLRVKPFGDVKTLDPMVNSDSMLRNHAYMIYDTLFAVDSQLAVKPQMVESWTTSEDGLVWSFTLRPGLVFSDGQKVTSADVIASIKRWALRDGFGQQLVARTASMEEIDPASFRLTLKAPWGLVLDALGKPSGQALFILPARLAANPIEKPIDDTTGSGPFLFRRDLWVPGSTLVYVRNPAYVPRAEPASGLAGGKRPGFDRVEWKIIPDSQTALNALRTGEIDILEEIPPDLIATAQRDKNIRLTHQDELGLQQVFRMNSLQPPFDNPKVRQAVRYAIDPEEYLRALTDGDTALIGRGCPSFYMCSSPYFTDAGWVKPDMATAKRLLAESGYDGTPAVLLDPTDLPGAHPHVLLADQMLREMGMKTDVQAMDWATLTARRASKEPVGKGGWSVFISGPSGPDMMEPVGHMGLRASCAAAWFGWPCDAEIEKLRAAFADAADPAARKKIATEVQLRAEVVAPYWPIINVFQVRAARADLKGILNPPAAVYWNITRD